MIGVDLKNKRFGKLLVIEQVENVNGRRNWKCICDCGNERIYSSERLKRLKRLSCGCIKQKPTRSITNEQFIDRAQKKHKNKYNYEKTNYLKMDCKVDIVCPKHGQFSQSPISHLTSPTGCPMCTYETYTFNYADRFKDNSILGSLYLFEITTPEQETFIKIGVSVNYKSRIRNYTKAGLKVKIVGVIPLPVKDSGVTERKILRYIRQNKFNYKPKFDFVGRTECVKLEFLENVLIKLESILMEAIKDE